MDKKPADAPTSPAAPKGGTPPRQPPYGRSENFGSPGGDEPLPSTDPGSGTPGEARERRKAPATK